ncbi:MAG: hypothetical protein EA412_00115 [Chitinophagaceae bacterium]|nr:MAG: hypothetical protein EA412_00115 [Chitinophagaceae bacterium]
MKICVLCSTNGGILSKLLQNSFFNSQVSFIVSDRICGVKNVAENFDKEFVILSPELGVSFSDCFLDFIQKNKVDYVFSVYTKILKGKLLETYKNRILNIHPSILPAFPGLSSFEKAMKAGVRFIGSTVHFIDKGVDTGPIIVQSSVPLNLTFSFDELRHIVFIDQCRIVLQAFKWIEEGRLKVIDDMVMIDSASYTSYRYSPNLDWNILNEFS